MIYGPVDAKLPSRPHIYWAASVCFLRIDRFLRTGIVFPLSFCVIAFSLVESLFHLVSTSFECGAVLGSSSAAGPCHVQVSLYFFVRNNMAFNQRKSWRNFFCFSYNVRATRLLWLISLFILVLLMESSCISFSCVVCLWMLERLVNDPFSCWPALQLLYKYSYILSLSLFFPFSLRPLHPITSFWSHYLLLLGKNLLRPMACTTPHSPM